MREAGPPCLVLAGKILMSSSIDKHVYEISINCVTFQRLFMSRGEIKVKCPYCNEEMIIGNIYGDRYILKWLPEDEKLFLGIWAKDSIK